MVLMIYDLPLLRILTSQGNATLLKNQNKKYINSCKPIQAFMIQMNH